MYIYAHLFIFYIIYSVVGRRNISLVYIDKGLIYFLVLFICRCKCMSFNTYIFFVYNEEKKKVVNKCS